MRRKNLKRLVGLLFIVFLFTLVSVLSLFLITRSHHRRDHEESQTERWLRTRRESRRSREEELPPEDHFERTMKELISQETDPRFEFQTLGNASAPKMGLLIPFRARDDYEEKRLSGFLWFMHWFFRTRTHLAYRMIVVEQEDGKPFNRGKLLNTGVLLSKDKFDYYVLHDLDERPWSLVDYSIPEQGAPTHMMTARSRYNYNPVTMEADPVYTGGVMKITAGDYAKVNGFSNSFWGWGHEDRDFGHRIWNSGLTLKRLAADIGRFRSTPEEEHGHRDKDSAEANAELVNHTTDGLSDTTFKLLSASHSQHHSRYLVSI